MKRWLIIGASRGLGDAFARGLPVSGDVVWLASQHHPDVIEENNGFDMRWIEVDLNQPQSTCDAVAAAIQDEPIDALIYNAGFLGRTSFDEMSSADISKHFNVNVGAALAIVSMLSNNLATAQGRIVLISSSAALDNEGSTYVAYSAAKAALRTASGSMRELFRPSGVAVTCIVPGSIATDVPFVDGVQKALDVHNGERIPVQDVVSLVSCILNLSPASCVKEVVVPALADSDI